MGSCFTKLWFIECANKNRNREKYSGRAMSETRQTSCISNRSNDITIPTQREFHQIEESTYWLPKDDEEQMRLTGQHFAFKELFGGNVLQSVTEVLDLKQGLSILDVGCGSGVWVMDMINDYPHCNYEGCDMVNIVAQKPTPKQFTFRIANVLQGLPYPDNTFDLVQLRLLVLALRNDEWPGVVKELVRVTKPGGLIQLMEPDYRVKGHNDAFCKVISALNTICEAKGQNPRIGVELEKLLREEGSTKIIETKSAFVDTTTRSSAAKKIAWSWMEALKGTMKFAAPMLGLKEEKDQQKFLKEFRNCMDNNCGELHMEAVVAQKL